MFHDYDWLLQSVLHRSLLAYYSILLFETPVIQAKNIFKHLIRVLVNFTCDRRATRYCVYFELASACSLALLIA